MQNQVSAVMRGMCYNIRRIARVKCHLTTSACAKAVTATVLSRLDYHNGLLLGAPEKTIKKPQVAQNNAARLLTGASRRDHMTPVLQQLHWLPVKARVTFKILTTIQKSLHSPTALHYLTELSPLYQPSRALRSSRDRWKIVRSRSENKYGARSYTSLGAELWNDLSKKMREPMSKAEFKGN